MPGAPWLPRALALVDAARDATPDHDLGNPTEEACVHGRAALRVLAEAGLPEPTHVDRGPDGLWMQWRTMSRRLLTLDVDNDGADDNGDVGCVAFYWYPPGAQRHLFAAYHPDTLPRLLPALRAYCDGADATETRQALVDSGIPFVGWCPDHCDDIGPWCRERYRYNAVARARARVDCAPPLTGACRP